MKICRAGLYALLIIALQEISFGRNLGFAASNEIACSNGVYKYYGLWGPHGSDGAHWRVAKWKKPIRIVMLDDTQGSSSARALKEKFENSEKEFQATSNVDITILPQSGTQTGDVVAVISTDLDASNDRNGNILTSMFRGANYSDPEAAARSSNVRFAWRASDAQCDGVVTGNTTEGIVGGYLFAKSEGGHSCVVRMFATMFGIGTPPSSAEDNIPGDDQQSLVLGALKELYRPEIVQGMDDAQVRGVMAENCK
ncbi:MAG: hypothetical protein E7774_06920 [Bradyrhizobium sp.]|nr:MAG: hypothetical protein E7774_06920 [Bradyrhizobium sp.]